MNTEVCVSLNRRAEKSASVVAGGLIVHPRSVCKENPSLQILKCFSKLPNAKILGLSAKLHLPTLESSCSFLTRVWAKEENVVGACGIDHHLNCGQRKLELNYIFQSFRGILFFLSSPRHQI